MQKHIKRGDTLDEILKTQRRPPTKPLSHYVAHYAGEPKRGMIAAFRTGDYTFKEIAEVFGVHYSTVSRAVRKAEDNRM